MSIILDGIFGIFLTTTKGIEIYDYTGTGTFVDVNYSRGTGTSFNRRYMRFSANIPAGDLASISNTNVTSVRITSNNNQNIDYTSFKVYMKNNGSNLDITGLSPNLTLTSGTFTGWTARGNYYYIDLQLDTPFVWDGANNIRIFFDFDVPNPSYSGADTSNFVAFVNAANTAFNYYVDSATALGDNPSPSYTFGKKLVNYLTFE